MSGFGSLLWKEWRDIRPVYLGCLLLAGAGVFSLGQLAVKWKQPEEMVAVIVPLATLLVGAIVAADVLSGDVKSRRIETLALLPVSAGRTLLAKLLFVGVATVAFAVLLTTWMGALHAVFAPKPWFGELLDGLAKGHTLSAFTLVAVAATVFFSAISMRSFVAALLGIALPAGAVALTAWLRLDSVLGFDATTQLWALSAGFSVLFLLAAALTYVRGPAHVAAERRLVMIGLGALAAFAVPVTGGVAWAVHDFYAVVPGGGDVLLDDVHVRPDESLVAITAYRNVRRGSKDTKVHETWVFDLATGEHVFESGREVRLAGWTPRGELWVWRPNPLPGTSNADNRGWLADPRTGDRIRVPERNEARDGLLTSMPRRSTWGTMANTNRKPGTRYVVTPLEGHDFGESFFHGYPCLLEKPGQVVAVTEAGALELRDVIAGASRVLIEKNAEYAGPWSVSPSQRYLSARVDGHPVVIELATGRIVFEEPSAKGSYQWARSGTRRDVLVAHSARSGEDANEAVARLIDLDRNVTIDLPPELRGHVFFAVRPLTDGRILMIARGKRLVLLAPDGTLERELYGPRAEE